MRNKWLSYGVLILGLILVVRTGMNVVRLWKAGEWVQEAKREVSEAAAENRQLRDTLSQVQTPEYQEREARDKLGYGRPGEIVLVMPEGLATASARVTGPTEPNWMRWRKLYLKF